MNLTDLTHNNNKFYIIQLIEADNKKRYWVYNRWGRGENDCINNNVTVGAVGADKCEECSSLEKAKKLFVKKYSKIELLK